MLYRATNNNEYIKSKTTYRAGPLHEEYEQKKNTNREQKVVMEADYIFSLIGVSN